MDEREQHTIAKSSAYRDGYAAYLSWSCNAGLRPENPYWSGHIDGESPYYEQWQQGWDDAAWDE
jgi:hypothetical protein